MMMEMFKLDRGDTQLQAYLFQSPEEKAVLQITHGAAEHARRYTEFAEWMAERGITVYTMDNRGHGLSQKEGEEHVIIAPKDANKLPEDVIALGEYIKERHEGKLFLLGHSMGSYINRAAATMTQIYDAFFFVGSGLNPNALIKTAKQLVKIMIRAKGPNVPSDILDELTFNSFKKELMKMGITQSEEEWLTSDPKKLLEILSDPYMTDQRFTLGAYNALYHIVDAAHNVKAMKNIRENAPIYFLSGENDPVGRFGTGVRELGKLYRKYSKNKVYVDIYPAMNHEILNEEEREEVYKDILGIVIRELAWDYSEADE